MCVDLDRGAVGICTGWPNRNVAQQTEAITSTTSSLMKPWTWCVPPERSLGIHGDRIFWVDPLSCGGQVEPWGIGGWCSVGVLPEDGV